MATRKARRRCDDRRARRKRRKFKKPKREAEAVTSAVVKIEGQEFPLPVSIAGDDELLKAALSPHYPSIKNAQISRETRAGQMIVSIVKKAEHKGSAR